MNERYFIFETIENRLTTNTKRGILEVEKNKDKSNRT